MTTTTNTTTTTQAAAPATLRDFRFGIEIETVNLSRESCARAIHSVVGGQLGTSYGLHGYTAYQVTAPDGRVWKAVHDGSIGDYNAEVVSPILTYADIETLQNVVRALHRAGARVNVDCGIHVHVDASRLGAKGLVNLAKLVHQQEDLIVLALGVQQARLEHFCKKTETEVATKIAKARPATTQDLARVWYNGQTSRSQTHYDGSRYHGLNLHSVWYRGTVEFRWFEATLHAGKVKSYVQFALALAAKAMTAKSTAVRKREMTLASAKYDMRVFLLRLGFIGDEFKSARKHLTAGLSGSAAWKNGRPAPTTPNTNDEGTVA
jgi:putative amidoligase enzyme